MTPRDPDTQSPDVSSGSSYALVAAVVPLVAFYVVEAQYGLRAGTLVAMILAALDMAWSRWRTGRVSRMTLFTALLIGILGGLSLYSEDERFVLYTPVAGDLIFAFVLCLSTIRGGSLLETGLREQDPGFDLHSLEVTFLRGVTWRFAANLVLHAMLTMWAAGSSREWWLFVSGPAQYVLFGVQFAGEAAYGRYIVSPRVEEALQSAQDTPNSSKPAPSDITG